MPNPIRVLIVEDSADDAKLMLRGLGDHGFAPQADRVETEAAYLAGLDAAPDVVIADYRLPQFSGLRALELLNERRLDIPFIVVSGDIGNEETAGLIRLGASDFLLKDRIARLGLAVTQALKLKRARDEQRQMEVALVKSEQRFRALSENSSDLMIIIDRRDMITYISPSLKRIGGYEVSDALDRNFFDFIHPEDVSAATTNFSAIIQNPDALRVVELRCRHKNGNWLTFETILRNALDEPVIGGIVVNAHDITERKNQEQKIARLSRIHAVLSGINSLIVRVRDRQELFNGSCRVAVEHGKLVMAWIGLLDPATQDVTVVAKAGQDDGYLEQIKLTLRNDVTRYRTLTAESLTRAVPVVCNDISVDERMSRWRDEALKRGYRSVAFFPLLIEQRPIGVFVLYAPELGAFDKQEMKLLTELANDISFALEYIAKEEKLNYLAYYDAVTGLPNRTLFDDRMAQTLRAASHEKSKTALVLIDLERFRVINDTLGRHIADGLLKLVAERLQSVVFDRDSLARAHADVFAGLFSNIKDEPDIARIVEEKIIGCLSQPFTIAGQELRVSARIGVAMFPDDATEPDVLFSSAEAALRQAKGSSDRYLFYAPKMNAMVAERLKLENKLQGALEREEFVLFYQPKVNLSTGRVSGLEALIRWNDPEGGLVMPMLFIPSLEETGMIVEAGTWAMKQTVSQSAAWQAAGLQPPPIAVNVSQVQLKRRDFVTSVQQAVAIAGKPDHGLDLEITESMIMEDIEGCIGKLKIIRDLGVGISIDDFGTGHSSLRYLTRLPITGLKIDRAFIQHMTTNPDDAAIVSTVIALGHNFKLKVIAEGVETEEQRKFLQLLKCDEFQGYLFSKPVPAEQVPALLAPRAKRAVG